MSGNITTKQLKVINYITKLIEENNLSTGEKIDTEVNIAKILDVTRTTVREATRHLLEEGLVYRVRNSGLHVNNLMPHLFSLMVVQLVLQQNVVYQV